MNRRSQFQWIVLLSAAIVLPTVSLLWFMSRVVINERLVIRQKLETLYEDDLKEAGEQARQALNKRFSEIDGPNWAQDPYGLLRRLVLKENFQGVVVWSREGSLIYPSIRDSFLSDNLSLSDSLAVARHLEFVDEDWAAAATEYGQQAQAAESRSVRQTALAGQVRCLAHLERWSDATAAALSVSDTSGAPACLLLLSLIGDLDLPTEKEQLYAALKRDLFRSDNTDATLGPDFSETKDYLPAEENLLLARKLQDLLPDDLADATSLSHSTQPAAAIDAAALEKLLRAEERSIAALRAYPVPSGPQNVAVPAQLGDERVYMHRYQTPSVEIMIVLTDEGLASELDGYCAELEGSDAHFRIFDAQGRLISGSAGEDIDAIASTPLPNGFPDGRIELFFADGDMFNKAASRQITVYIWTGAMVILVILLVGLFAGQAVGRQIRLNKMKNNFIATVSHELKTPLASMRLLVDTLLEKRVRDEAHAEEYLNMIARENERLTRVIENFLSFSRMERNRNAFTMLPTAPTDIVENAVESICTKYKANGCKLEMDIADDLPEITVDADALVTVLINLLDNACKYTDGDKQIRLSLTAENGEICFAVSDNGIGLTRRQIRKIFNHFYQVDSSLARSSEGCGLGLSIVQFIVNAHKGRIDVESRLGEGSTFSVHLPRND